MLPCDFPTANGIEIGTDLETPATQHCVVLQTGPSSYCRVEWEDLDLKKCLRPFLSSRRSIPHTKGRWQHNRGWDPDSHPFLHCARISTPMESIADRSAGMEIYGRHRIFWGRRRRRRTTVEMRSGAHGGCGMG